MGRVAGDQAELAERGRHLESVIERRHDIVEFAGDLDLGGHRRADDRGGEHFEVESHLLVLLSMITDWQKLECAYLHFGLTTCLALVAFRDFYCTRPKGHVGMHWHSP